ncbi:hypothetical protein ACFVAE_14225 [Microbacterium sp. NPDC057659]|uniref:hypothetical protein n=1 Tax=Microbacterium sp. NPDC057659 TaxID=3346198 RepID=UPI00366B28AD
MHHRTALPERLGPAFSLTEAAEAGVGRGRRDARDLHRPYRGVRSAIVPATFAERVACYRPRLKHRQRYVGRAAARLWGLPFPHSWSPAEPLEIAVPLDATPPKVAGVQGRRLAEHRATTWRVRESTVVDPIAALFTCAHELTMDQAVIMIDAIITTADNYPGLLSGRPLLTREDIAARRAAWGFFRGCAMIDAALHLARERVESPKETETRRLIARTGLPEPVVQYEIHDQRRLIGRVDLAYPELKIAIEYEGDGHRIDKAQWRRDIQRQRDLEDRGWIVIRLTQDDLGPGAPALIARIRRAVLSRTV